MKKPLLLLALTTPLWAQPVLTPKALIGEPRPQECHLSPNGRWLAVQTGTAQWKLNRMEAGLTLYATDALAKPALHIAEADTARWSPDSSQLLFSKKGKLWVCPTSTWKARPFLKAEADDPVWSPDGKRIAYAAPAGPEHQGDSGRLYDDLFLRRWNHYYDGRRRHLFVTDLQGHTRDVTPGDRDASPTSGTFSSGDNLCFSPDGRALFYSAPPPRGQASSTNYDVYRVDLGLHMTTNLTQANLAADTGPRVAGNRLYLITYTRPGYESDFPVVKSCALGPGGQLVGDWKDEKLGDDLGQLSWGGGHRLTTLHQQNRQRGYLDQRALPHQGSLYSLSAGGNHWAGIETGLALPSRVVVGNLDNDKITTLGPLPHWKLGAVESVEFPVEGATMQMWIIKPPNYRADKKWPVVVLVHGGPQGGWGNGWSTRWNPQVWAAQGYLVAMPNPRGTSGRGRAFQEQVSRDWGGLAYRDLMTAVDLVAARPDVDPDRMAAAGASYGGYMVNWISVQTGRFKALVTHDGVWNLESMYGTTDELWFADWEFGGPPWGPGRPPDYDRFSPHRFAERLGQFKTPHMVIHNDKDYRCPMDQGLQLFTALQLQGVESRFLNFPDEGHWVGKPANSLRWHQEIFRFLKDKLHP